MSGTGDQTGQFAAAEPLAAAVPGVTVVVLARDAEDILGPCLESLAGFHPVMVVVDGRSADGTAALAERWGAVVKRLPWQGGFAAQRNVAAGLADSDMVFFLDADERVTPDLREEIDRLLRGGPSRPAYSVRRRNNLLGAWLRFGGWWPDRQVRLVNRLEAKYVGAVHERVDLPESAIGRLDGVIEHYTHPTVAAVLQRADEYSRLEAEEALSEGLARPTGAAVWLSPLVHVFRRAVLQLGILDGRAGWAEARLQAYYRHLVCRRRRSGPTAEPDGFFQRLIPAEYLAVPEPQPEALPRFPSDLLALGALLLLALLPLHLLIKRMVPGSVGTDWKEVFIGLLALVAVVRLWPVLRTAFRHSWLFRLSLAYGVLVIARTLFEAHGMAGFQGIHVDLTYLPLLVILLALPIAQRLPVLAYSAVGLGVVCAAGAVTEMMWGHALFPSATLLEQYGRAEVYINGTHVLRPYFTFDFPTGLGAFLAMATVTAVALGLLTQRLWPIAAAAITAVGLVLTFSRGPWIGCLVGLAVVAVLAVSRPLILRLGAVSVMAVLLVASALLTNGAGRPVARPITLHNSPQLRILAGQPRHERTVRSLLPSGDLVARSGLPPPSPHKTAVFWRIGGRRSQVLSEPPPPRGHALLSYRLRVPDGALLAWGIALDPRVWRPERGDGVTFRVSIEDQGTTSPVFAWYLDPKNRAADRRVLGFRVPLYGFAGDTVRINLTTDAGPLHDADYDWAGWLDPRVVLSPMTAALDRFPYRMAPASTLERPVVRSGAYLASIANWQGDQSNSDRLAAWGRTISAWERAPLLGLGPGSVDEAATRVVDHLPLTTESQLGKVLVETGAVGLVLWLSLCGAVLGLLAAAYRRFRTLEYLLPLAAGCCILVCSLAFQVLEVKQIAALFWSVVGFAVVAELELQGISVAPREWPVGDFVPESWPRSLGGLLEGLGLPARPRITPAVAAAAVATSAPAGPIAIDGNGSGVHEAPAPRGDADGRSEPATVHAAARLVTAGVGMVDEVVVAANQLEANRLLDDGWELLSTGVATAGAVFVLGRRNGNGH